jgi:phosphatidylinositol mannoside-binding LppM-like protein
VTIDPGGPPRRPSRGDGVWHDDQVRARQPGTRPRTRLLALMLVLLIMPAAVGCVRARASITVSPDDRVSGQIIAAAKPRDADDKGPQLLNNLPFATKVAVSEYNRDDYVGSQAVFSDLTFAELPQLANMSRDAAGVDISLRRAGDLVILEGRVDLTSLTDPDADVSMSVSFPGEVTSTNGDQVSAEVVEWKLRPGVVTTMNAQARYTDPSARSFTGAAIWLTVASLLVAAIVGGLAWASRDRSPKLVDPYGPDH